MIPLAKVQTDFNKLATGDWFLPMTLKGQNQHALVEGALQKGIAGLVTEAGQRVPGIEIPQIEVPDLREYLFSLARVRRLEIRTKISVIAGSAGKTSVKEMVGAILKAHNPSSFMSPDNQNTKIALATQVLRMDDQCELACFEMGARKVHDFATPLAWLCPDVVTLINIGSAHVGEFGSVANLVREKLSVLEHPSAGCLVVCADDSRMMEKAQQQNKRIISFGRSEESRVQLCHEDRGKVLLRIEHQECPLLCPFETPAKGMNVAAAVATALALDIPMEAIVKGLAGFSGVSRRFEFFKWGAVEAIDDAFNASPESLSAGLMKLAELGAQKKLLLVLGSMLELGADSEQAHRGIASMIQSLFLTQQISVALIGAEAAWIGHELKDVIGMNLEVRYYADARVARADLEVWREKFDLVYFKASKSLKLNHIFGACLERN